jgi:hypothetical protein
MRAAIKRYNERLLANCIIRPQCWPKRSLQPLRAFQVRDTLARNDIAGLNGTAPPGCVFYFSSPASGEVVMPLGNATLQGAPMQPDSQFLAASQSKMFTGMALPSAHPSVLHPLHAS